MERIVRLLESMTPLIDALMGAAHVVARALLSTLIFYDLFLSNGQHPFLPTKPAQLLGLIYLFSVSFVAARALARWQSE